MRSERLNLMYRSTNNGLLRLVRNYSENVTSVCQHEYKQLPMRKGGWRVTNGKLMRRSDEIYALKKRKILHPGFYTEINSNGTVVALVEGKLILRKELAETAEYLKSNDLRDMTERLHAHILPNLPPIKIKFNGFRKERFTTLKPSHV